MFRKVTISLILAVIVFSLISMQAKAGPENKYTTILYSVWHDYWLQLVQMNPNTGEPYLQPEAPPWGPYSVFHWWGTPAFSAPKDYKMMINENPDMPNNALIDNHISLLSAAGIDFISIDLSNGSQTLIVDGAKAVCKRYSESANPPKIAFFVLDDATAQVVYDTFYSGAYPSSLWFYYAGKPLILTANATTGIPTGGIWDQFTARKCWGLENSTDFWSFKESTPPATAAFSQWNWPEEMSVCAATQGDGPISDPTSNRKGRDNGNYFAEQWNYISRTNPTFVFITSWNEWGAQNLGDETNYIFMDHFLTEYSADLEPMSGGHGSWYYDLMKNYISNFKRNVPNFAIRNSSNGIWYFKFYYGSKNLDGSNYTFSWNWASGSNYQSFVGDYNNDGYNDVGLRNTTNGTIYFAERNQSAYAFNNNQNFNWVSGSNYQIIAGDINNDGKLDIILRDTSNGKWHFATQNATTWYAFNHDYSFTWASGSNYQPFVGDFNKDGKLDIGLRDTTNGQWHFATQNSTYWYLFNHNNSITWASGSNYQALTGDIDLDTNWDIGLFDTTDGKIYLTNGNSAYSFPNDDDFQWISGTDYEVHLLDATKY